jgi:hypothetical protein
LETGLLIPSVINSDQGTGLRCLTLNQSGLISGIVTVSTREAITVISKTCSVIAFMLSISKRLGFQKSEL